MSDLIDTTEMYLRTVYELEEEGITPLRARIAERLSQSGPTVSQTVGRMERDGLITVEGDRHLELTDRGRQQAMRVMRKHRLAECLLVTIVGLPWEQVHTEACRWEHVISDEVERRLLVVLGNPTQSPFGNPIPGLDELDPANVQESASLAGLQTLDRVAGVEPIAVIVRRIGEPAQNDEAVLARLRRAGVVPGATVRVQATPGGVLAGSMGEYAEFSVADASHILVEA